MKSNKEVIIKAKVHIIGDIVLLIPILIMSIAGFIGYIGQGEEKSIGALFVGIIFGCLFILIFQYLTNLF